MKVILMGADKIRHWVIDTTKPISNEELDFNRFL